MILPLVNRLGVFLCFGAACIGLSAQNGEDRNYKVFSTFSEDFNGDKGDFSDLISLHGSTRHQGGEIGITSNRNSQNGAVLLDDFSDSTPFSDFELSFRLFMGNGFSGNFAIFATQEAQAKAIT